MDGAALAGTKASAAAGFLRPSVSKTQAIAASFAVSSTATVVLYSVLQSTATDLKTMRPDWMAAQNDCANFQKQDPIKIN
eukprot:g9103.t1